MTTKPLDSQTRSGTETVGFSVNTVHTVRNAERVGSLSVFLVDKDFGSVAQVTLRETLRSKGVVLDNLDASALEHLGRSFLEVASTQRRREANALSARLAQFVG